jgi:hypothetical protein
VLPNTDSHSLAYGALTTIHSLGQVWRFMVMGRTAMHDCRCRKLRLDIGGFPSQSVTSFPLERQNLHVRIRGTPCCVPMKSDLKALPRLVETWTMFPLNQEGARQHLQSTRPGSTMYHRSRAYEIVGCAFTSHPYPGELGRYLACTTPQPALRAVVRCSQVPRGGQTK